MTTHPTTATEAAATIAAQVNGMADIAKHASTPAGARETQVRQQEAEDDGNLLLANYLDSCIIIGLQIRDTYDAIEAELAAHAAAD